MITDLIKCAETEFFPWVHESLSVENEEQFKNISDVLGVGKKITKNLEDARKEEKQPFIDGGKAVDDKYKPIQARISLGINLLDKALLSYHNKKKNEADALLQMQMQEEAKKIEECKQTGEVYEAPQAITQTVSQTVHGNMSTTSVIEGFNYEIVDDSLIPRDCCSGDLKKIKAKHKYDGLPIPGVLITPHSRTQTRLG